MSEATLELPKDFGFGTEEVLLRDMARKFFREELPIEKLRRLVAADPEATYERGERPAWDEGLWKHCVELGWTGLAVPEENGGTDFPLVGIAALVEEAGRAAFPSPLVPTLCATFVLRKAGTAVADAWLERVANGSALSLAITDATGSWEPEHTDVRLENGRLQGQAHFVQDAFKADAFAVLAKDGEACRLVVVPADADGLSVAQDHIHDLTRDQAVLRFDRVRVSDYDLVASDGASTLRAAWPAILVLVSADLCGTSEWQLQTTAEYAKVRKQFDRPLGFFQAVKHPLSDAMLKIDRARSLLYWAACCVDHPDATTAQQTETAARMAKSAASDAGRFASDRSVQLHGGIGFTWESDVHIYFKRSMHNQALYGDGRYQRARVADAIIGPVGG
ncbi:MAG: acyl-CoA dehydrogenase family protein [Phycisphaerales bacterium JB058]